MPRVKTISDVAVLDAALDLLLEQGPHRFTLPAVGRAVGLSPATLIQRFGSKKGLLTSVIDHAGRQADAALQARVETDDARADLIGWLVDLAAGFKSRAHVASNLALLMEDLTDEQSRAQAGRHMQIVRRGVARHLSRLGDEAVDAHVELIEAQWHGLVIQWALHGQGDCEAWIAEGISAVIDLVVPPRASSR